MEPPAISGGPMINSAQSGKAVPAALPPLEHPSLHSGYQRATGWLVLRRRVVAPLHRMRRSRF